MPSSRDERLKKLLRVKAAEFFERESNGTSLITVTKCDISPDWKRATIYISVLPEDKEGEAITFIKRRLHDFREIVKKEATFKIIPFFEVALDIGEKNRARIDELLRSENT